MPELNEDTDDPAAKRPRTTPPLIYSEDNNDVQCLEIKKDELRPGDLDPRKRQVLSDFMSISNTEEQAALSLLESSGWNVNRALDFFFGNEEEDEVEVVQQPDTQSSCESAPVDLSGLEVSLVSWNIDGLDGNSLATRMKAVYKIINNLNPDFVFLQEVVTRELATIDRLSKLYNIFYSNKDYLYYTAILVSKVFEVKQHEVIHYQNSGMGRTLQIIEGKIGEQRVFLLNTHLESMREHSKARKEQFQICMRKIQELISRHPNCLLFFGGDLNIRDDEVANVPRGVADAWLAAGAKKDTEFTWDTRKNDNKHSFGARNRFDRVFWYGPLSKVKFALAGQQRIRSCLCFPSDHWAVHCEFS
ncbi:Tyrosyl-DNA phosphodiesterase [Trichostrongylus colubriformis]|uniref:Tyrosyl-DNA phosphodiesterase n=1 Tax=Trichostrongylus colubriformis TaxID=6319 RepID=A0AAN8EMR2_TRICO